MFFGCTPFPARITTRTTFLIQESQATPTHLPLVFLIWYLYIRWPPPTSYKCGYIKISPSWSQQLQKKTTSRHTCRHTVSWCFFFSNSFFFAILLRSKNPSLVQRIAGVLNSTIPRCVCHHLVNPEALGDWKISPQSFSKLRNRCWFFIFVGKIHGLCKFFFSWKNLHVLMLKTV